MTRDEFLLRLESELGFLPASEVKRAVRYYEDILRNVGFADDVTAITGDVKDAAKKYYADNCIKSDEAYEYPDEKKKFPWILIIAVILSPVLIPVILTIVGIVLLIAMIPALISWTILISGFGVITNCFRGVMSVYDVFARAGIGCILFAIGLVLTWLSVLLLIKVCVWLIKTIADYGNRKLHKTDRQNGRVI